MRRLGNKIDKLNGFSPEEITVAKQMADKEFIKTQIGQQSFEQRIVEHDRELAEATDEIRKELEEEDINAMSSETQQGYFLNHIQDIREEINALAKRKKTLKFLLSSKEKESVRAEEAKLQKDLELAESNFDFLAIKNIGPINQGRGELVPDVFIASIVQRIGVLRELKKSKKNVLGHAKGLVIGALGLGSNKEDEKKRERIRLSIIDEEIRKAQAVLDDYIYGDKKVDIENEALIDSFVAEAQKRRHQTATGVSEFQADIEKEVFKKTMDIFSAVEYKTREGKNAIVYPKDFNFKIKDSHYDYRISKGQNIIFNNEETSFVGLSKDGGLVFWDGNFAREVSKEDFGKYVDGKNLVTYEAAITMLGRESIVGPEDISGTFDLKVESIEPIPFTKEEIEIHKSLGHRLTYEVRYTPDGVPLKLGELAKRVGSNVIGPNEYRLYKERFDDSGNIKKDAWFAKDEAILNELPDGGWKFVSDEIIPGSTSKNYIEQTDFLIKYFADNIFKDSLPDNYKKAFQDWERDKPVVKGLISQSKWLEVAKVLSDHPVSRLLRENFPSTVFRTIIMQKEKDKKILVGNYSWSRSFSSGGDLVNFGVFGAEGADVDGAWPLRVWTFVGAVFSRRVSKHLALLRGVCMFNPAAYHFTNLY
ncbi:MAG: hypothetical protein HZA94_03160 [Candidatus Vogelbacteria bacterium]|nr:hypothetical protein [Candidatus Vogelbacteria bacterium]